MEAPKKTLLFLIRVYQKISASTVPSCRFNPSCSVFTYTAVGSYGIIKGISLSIKRIMRCHPWSKGGFDPVP